MKVSIGPRKGESKIYEVSNIEEFKKYADEQGEDSLVVKCILSADGSQKSVEELALAYEVAMLNLVIGERPNSTILVENPELYDFAYSTQYVNRVLVKLDLEGQTYFTPLPYAVSQIMKSKSHLKDVDFVEEVIEEISDSIRNASVCIDLLIEGDFEVEELTEELTSLLSIYGADLFSPFTMDNQPDNNEKPENLQYLPTCDANDISTLLEFYKESGVNRFFISIPMLDSRANTTSVVQVLGKNSKLGINEFRRNLDKYVGSLGGV